VAARETAAAGVPAAPERALEHVRRAQRDAEEMVAAARAQVAVADDNYRTAHEAAIVAGWSAATLTGMGYPPARSAGAGSQRKRTAASRSASASVRELPAADRRTGTSRTQPDGGVDAPAATVAG
jgi:hypothetical protein